MSVLDIASTEEIARARAERIRKGLENWHETIQEISLAWERRDWAVLGYATWDAYVDGEFAAARLRLPEAHRLQAVTALRLAGMSTRAIGTALGISKDTAARALAAVAAEDPAALPATVTSLDGRQRPATRPTPPAPADPPANSADVVGPAGPGGPPADEQVWVAAARRGIEAHALKTKASTRCSRSTRTGLTLPAGQAAARHDVTWCAKCWPPDETTRFAAGEPSEAHDPRASDPAGAEVRGSAPADPETAADAGRAPVGAVPPADGAAETDADDGEGRRPAVPGAVAVTEPAPAPAPPAASPAGGAGVAPGLDLGTIARLRAAFRHFRAVGGTRTEPRQYELPFASTAPPLHRGGVTPVDVVDVQWFPPTDVCIRWLSGGGRYEPVGGTDFYPATVSQALDVLCALGILPAQLSSQYAAGVQAGLRGGDAIDGELIEEDKGA
ncbi:hypothetical protein AB0N38_33225 [Micromonospora aurantiaca]|uniref:hypothetical protein n=1 Tax=Micromonospora aurantiaca (nom. illeg.) TaxID=47850 RepID=UPI0034126325